MTYMLLLNCALKLVEEIILVVTKFGVHMVLHGAVIWVIKQLV